MIIRRQLGLSPSEEPKGVGRTHLRIVPLRVPDAGALNYLGIKLPAFWD